LHGASFTVAASALLRNCKKKAEGETTVAYLSKSDENACGHRRGTVERINGFVAFSMGVTLAELAAVTIPPASPTFADVLERVVNAKARLEEFLSNRGPLHGSKDRARNILGMLDQIQTGASATPQSQVPPGVCVALWNETVAFQNVFQTECARLPLFLVTERRGWDMTLLSEWAEHALPLLAWSSLTNTERADVRAAGRCLAFEIPTAAVFHMYRLLESFVLKYMPLLGVELREPDRNLGNYIKILKANGVSAKITDMLQHLKDEYRNPAIHPGLFFDIDGAASQFAFVQGVTHMIAEDILARLGEHFVWPSSVMAAHFAYKRENP
jgi:hypothetical protein